jgi:hypothetical protein
MRAVTVAFFKNFTAGESPTTYHLLPKKISPLYKYLQEGRKENKIKIIPNCQSMMTKRKLENFSP